MTPDRARVLLKRAPVAGQPWAVQARRQRGDVLILDADGGVVATVSDPDDAPLLAHAHDLVRAYLAAEEQRATLQAERDDARMEALSHGVAVAALRWQETRHGTQAEQEADDAEADRIDAEIAAMSDAEIDQALRDDGGDPEAIAARGEQLARAAVGRAVRFRDLRRERDTERVVARVAYAERDAAHAGLTAAGVDDGREEGDPPTGYGLPTRIGLLVEERDELRLVLLAEQGDPAGAPSEGWSVGGDGSWRKGGAPGTDTTYRVVSFVAPARHGRAAVRAWRVRPAGGADIGGEAPTAREAMQAADKAVQESER